MSKTVAELDGDNRVLVERVAGLEKRIKDLEDFKNDLIKYIVVAGIAGIVIFILNAVAGKVLAFFGF